MIAGAEGDHAFVKALLTLVDISRAFAAIVSEAQVLSVQLCVEAGKYFWALNASSNIFALCALASFASLAAFVFFVLLAAVVIGGSRFQPFHFFAKAFNLACVVAFCSATAQRHLLDQAAYAVFL